MFKKLIWFSLSLSLSPTIAEVNVKDKINNNSNIRIQASCDKEETLNSKTQKSYADNNQASEKNNC